MDSVYVYSSKLNQSVYGWQHPGPSCCYSSSIDMDSVYVYSSKLNQSVYGWQHPGPSCCSVPCSFKVFVPTRVPTDPGHGTRICWALLLPDVMEIGAFSLCYFYQSSEWSPTGLRAPDVKPPSRLATLYLAWPGLLMSWGKMCVQMQICLELKSLHVRTCKGAHRHRHADHFQDHFVFFLFFLVFSLCGEE